MMELPRRIRRPFYFIAARIYDAQSDRSPFRKTDVLDFAKSITLGGATGALFGVFTPLWKEAICASLVVGAVTRILHLMSGMESGGYHFRYDGFEGGDIMMENTLKGRQRGDPKW